MWASGLLELRIDVQLPPSEVEKELDAINRRLHRPGDALYDLPTLDITFPGLRFRYRVADGEHYIYVEDVKRGCLAGYTALRTWSASPANAYPAVDSVLSVD